MSNYLKINNQKLHFYIKGEGPALVLLHPSPSSGTSLLPLAEQLATHFTVFCIDTPGYGLSDSLQNQPSHLAAYTTFLYEAFQKMGLKKPSIYGSATGAQLAIRYALDYPDAVSQLFLDNSAHFDDALAANILKDYFPDLSPQLDGSHLTQIWTIVSRLFQYFPWCYTTKEYALNRPQMPLFVLQMVAIDYLKAGASYDLAYKLAFQHERGHFVQQLKVPTTIFRWNNSIITKYVDQLLAFDFDAHIQPVKIEGDANERNQKMVETITEKVIGLPTSSLDYSVIHTQKPVVYNYNQPSDNAPEVLANGEHLLEAWRNLVASNPQANAINIQHYLVDWYSRT